MSPWTGWTSPASGHRWQKIVGYVAQDVYILDSTLAENVAFDRRPEDINRRDSCGRWTWLSSGSWWKPFLRESRLPSGREALDSRAVSGSVLE